MKYEARHVDWASVRRVLVIKLRHHGDVLLTTPVLRTLKQQMPQVEVDVLVYDETRDMLADNPHIDRLFTIKKTRAAGGSWAKLKLELGLLRDLRARQYDVLISLTEHNRGASLARLLRPRWAISQDGPYNGFYKRSFSHLFQPVWLNKRHAVERNLDALRTIGLFPRDEDKTATLVPGAAAQQTITALLATHGLAAGGYILVHPGSRWAYKTWTAEKVAGLIAQLMEEGHRIVVSGSPDGAERALADAILAALPQRDQVVDVVGRLSLRELGELIRQSRMLIGVDSVPMHMAAALNTPVVALFGPSGQIEWGPWGGTHRIIRLGLPCQPCELKGCGNSGYSQCLATLPIATVHAAAIELLQLKAD
ncbi:MAG: putative lipopolysaccharide heptosyltransferase III [Burkholderiales bacterium]|nr:putative lipopolysaccharide heptosyltransferase III [Burkholderiales bacterium]